MRASRTLARARCTFADAECTAYRTYDASRTDQRYRTATVTGTTIADAALVSEPSPGLTCLKIGFAASKPLARMDR
jgi:hypothetical protein